MEMKGIRTGMWLFPRYSCSCEVSRDAEREVAMKMLLPVFYCGTVGLAGSYFPHRNFLVSKP
jgi:hypothetical protein